MSSEKDRIAIVVVGYNRIAGIKRLLESLLKAQYPNTNVPLYISIDCSGNQELYDYANSFEWPYGTKYVDIKEERLGLKKHIYYCGDLTKRFKAVVLLEDDLWVSPDFYNYTVRTVDKYGNSERVSSIALYSYEFNEFKDIFFYPIHNGWDVYAMQQVCTWGQIWTEQMWTGFKSWLQTFDEDFQRIEMPYRIKLWERAWSKYYYAYTIATNKFIIYPYQSLTTNFNDVGGEHGGGDNFFQVSLLTGTVDYRLPSFEEMEKYDVFLQNIRVVDYLPVEKESVCVDLYGQKELSTYSGYDYLLTMYEYPFQVVKSYGLNMIPPEMNVINDIHGIGIFLYSIQHMSPQKEGFLSALSIRYFTKRFDYHFLERYVLWRYKLRVMSKIRRVLKLN